MIKYPKIDSIFKRTARGDFTNQYAQSEFGYLRDCVWEWTEKIDGTNIRIGWDGKERLIGGRTASAQIPTFLFSMLDKTFTPDKLAECFGEAETDAVIFGEGYGAKIQKRGDNYIPDGVSMILFDVKVGPWWLTKDAVNEIASVFELGRVPVVGMGNLDQAVEFAKAGFPSHMGPKDFRGEGIVLRTPPGLLGRNGNPIMTKLKYKDWRHERNETK